MRSLFLVPTLFVSLLLVSCGGADDGAAPFLPEPVEASVERAGAPAAQRDAEEMAQPLQRDASSVDDATAAPDEVSASTGPEVRVEPQRDAAREPERPPEPVPYCGDGLIDPGEFCDEGEDNGSYGHCLADCSGLGPHCGDGVVDVDAGELCDDGVNDALAGGCLPGCEEEDLSDAVFEEGLLMVDITLAPDKWEALRTQRKTRHGMFGKADCRNEVIANPYTWFDGTVTINGTTITHTGLRKKGHIGSQSTTKPSLKVKFHEFVPGQNYKTLKRFALNNGKNDPSYLRTCMAYRVFSAAGIPAPRCTFAHVTVNGVALGPYVAVEEYKKPFMRRHFTDISGNLYEGTACDWRPEFFGGFEQETNVLADPSKADLQAVMDVLTFASDEALEATLADVFDLDTLYRFWAVESLIWHRDGYSGNANNYMVYADPQRDGRFVFLPWGPDGTFKPDNRASVPDSVLAFGAIVHRLYQTDAGRSRFYQELFSLLDTIWDPEVMVAESEIIEATLSAHLSPHEVSTYAAAVDLVQSTILERRAVIEEVLAAGEPEWSVGMRTLPCIVPVAPISGTFQTTWGTLSDPIWDAGSGTLSLDLGEGPLSVTNSGARVGWKNTHAGRAQLHLNTDDNRRVKITFNFPDVRFFDDFLLPGTHALIRPPMNSVVVVQDLSGAQPNATYDIGEGTWTFVDVGDEAGDAIAVEFEGTLYVSVNN